MKWRLEEKYYSSADAVESLNQNINGDSLRALRVECLYGCDFDVWAELVGEMG